MRLREDDFDEDVVFVTLLGLVVVQVVVALFVLELSLQTKHRVDAIQREHHRMTRSGRLTKGYYDQTGWHNTAPP